MLSLDAILICYSLVSLCVILQAKVDCVEESRARDSTLSILFSCPLRIFGLVVVILYSEFSTYERVFYWLAEKTQQDDVQSTLCSVKSRTGLSSAFLTLLYDYKSCVYAQAEEEYFSELAIFPAPE